MFASCKKETFYTSNDATLNFSCDTLSFDTIFSNIGTITKRLMVYNPYSDALKISSVKLAQGDDSPYIININGSAKEAGNIIIEPNDSMYILVQIVAKTTENDLPEFIKDSIIFNTNGKQQNIKLITYVQDAFVLKDSVIVTQTWSGQKPYLIYGDLTVDSANTLYINPGVKIYMHRDANIYIKGNIQASGSFYDPIVFRQDRFDDDYKDIPGQWGGIYLTPKTGSGPNKLEWVTIENGTTGLQLGDAGHNIAISIDLSNVIIQNMGYACLIAYRSSIYGTNCLIANGRNYTCYFAGGGTFQFYQSTFANYYSPYDYRDNNSPLLYLSNYLEKENDATQYDPYDISNSFFRNCIIYGSQRDEIKLDIKANAASGVTFENCIIRGENTSAYLNKCSEITWNSDPKFINGEYLNFKLDTLSPAKNKGAKEWGTYAPYDLNNISRMNDEAPDLGAYERIEKK
jgi:hypothetical protein